MRTTQTGTGTSRIVHGYTPGTPLTAADAAALGALIKQSQEIGDPGKTVKKAVGKAKK